MSIEWSLIVTYATSDSTPTFYLLLTSNILFCSDLEPMLTCLTNVNGAHSLLNSRNFHHSLALCRHRICFLTSDTWYLGWTPFSSIWKCRTAELRVIRKTIISVQSTSTLDQAIVNGLQRPTRTGAGFKRCAKRTTLIIFMAVGGRDLKISTLRTFRSIDLHKDPAISFGWMLGKLMTILFFLCDVQDDEKLMLSIIFIITSWKNCFNFWVHISILHRTDENSAVFWRFVIFFPDAFIGCRPLDGAIT